VIDVEPLIARELGRLVPEPGAVRADWNDVVGRAGLARSRRRVVLAFAVIASAVVTAAAVAKTLGGFDDWLKGVPGKPAEERAQKRFTAANGHSWVGFPTSTKLRELIRTSAAGTDYVLYGFRSGNSLCLQLAASGFSRQPKACAPASTLANLSAPILVLTGDHTFVDRGARPFAEVSFGIVADGVRRVDVSTTDGVHRARLGGNAYLFVESRPNTANRIFAVSAADPAGRRTVVRITSSPWLVPFPDPPGGWMAGPVFGRNGEVAVQVDLPDSGWAGVSPGGPATVEARIRHPTIRWSERGEKRGFPLAGIRFVKPDPLSDLAVGLSGDCLYAVNSSGSLAVPSCGLFFREPIRVVFSCVLCGEFSEVRGAAADGVKRIVIFLSDGSTQTVPLRHNLFAARVATAHFPVRIVGYDARDRVVAIQVWATQLGTMAPLAARRVHEVSRSTGPNGTTARLLVGRRVRGFHCWRAEFSTGQSHGGCVAPIHGGARTSVDLVQPAGGDLFFVGQAGARVVRVEVRFVNGDVVQARPMAGHFVAAVPRAHLSSRQQRAFVEAFDGEGFRIRRQRVFFRLP
jgi:hypothetical protein